jgi:tetratricopeptide (TPR) repeat protein
MSNEKLQFLSPLFLKYQSDFEKNPRSRVFAPLAESYRKIGMTDKAMEILSQGIRHNPGYVMGYMGLAFCYFDLKQYNLAYSTLRPLVENNRDNIRLQRLFADTCIAINHKDEALETLKYLLFINPRDKDIAKLVSTLEAEVEEQYRPQHKPIVIPAEEFSSNEELSQKALFDVDKLNATPKIDFDDWLHIDFAQTQQNSKKESNIDGWSVQKLNAVEKKINEPIITKSNIDSDAETPTLDLKPEFKKEEAPIVTHTLVDLYCGQGHVEKALELLEKILILNPSDQKTIEKIKEIKALVSPDSDSDSRMTSIDQEEHDDVDMTDEDELVSQFTSNNDESNQAQVYSLVDIEELDNVTEEDGRRNLMNILDEKVLSLNDTNLVAEISESDNNKKEEIQRKLGLFLKLIHEKALDYQNRF